MASAWLVVDHEPGLECIEHYASVADAVGDLRSLWHEDDGPQTFVVMDDGGVTRAVLMRLDSDPELCRTIWTTGLVELHRIWYVVDAETGEYVSTQIREEPHPFAPRDKPTIADAVDLAGWLRL